MSQKSGSRTRIEHGGGPFSTSRGRWWESIVERSNVDDPPPWLAVHDAGVGSVFVAVPPRVLPELLNEIGKRLEEEDRIAPRAQLMGAAKFNGRKLVGRATDRLNGDGQFGQRWGSDPKPKPVSFGELKLQSGKFGMSGAFAVRLVVVPVPETLFDALHELGGGSGRDWVQQVDAAVARLAGHALYAFLSPLEADGSLRKAPDADGHEKDQGIPVKVEGVDGEVVALPVRSFGGEPEVAETAAKAVSAFVSDGIEHGPSHGPKFLAPLVSSRGDGSSRRTIVVPDRLFEQLERPALSGGTASLQQALTKLVANDLGLELLPPTEQVFYR